MGAKQSNERGPVVATAPAVATSEGTSDRSTGDSSQPPPISHHRALTLQDIALSRAHRELPRHSPSRPRHSNSLRGSADSGSGTRNDSGLRNVTHPPLVQAHHSNRERDRGREVRHRERGTSQPHQIRLGHARPGNTVEFAIPSLEQRLVVPRPRSHDGGSPLRDERRRRVHTAGAHGGSGRRRIGGGLSTSAPANSLLFIGRGLSRIKCPLCSKEVMSPEFEEHLLSCVTRPRVSYNVDNLQQDFGECSICLDDMLAGDEIARLPCLCVYHIKCLQQWYTVSQTCPEHPEVNYT